MRRPRDLSTTGDDVTNGTKNLTIDDKSIVYAVVDYDDETNYVQPKIIASLQKLLPGVKVLKTAKGLPKKDGVKVLDWSSYEKLDFDSIMEKPEDVLACSYVIRFVHPFFLPLSFVDEMEQESSHPETLSGANRPTPYCQKSYLFTRKCLPHNMRV
jgi:hypothetical protein